MEVLFNMIKTLDEIEGFAYKYLTAEEISIILDIEVYELNDKAHAYGRAFLKGKLMRKAAFNLAVITLSDQLSSPAQAIELKIAEKNDLGGVQS